MESKNLSYKSDYHAPLDGLRGIAILLVIFYHCLGTDTFFISQISTLGWCGVDLFFVLSGFLITGQLLDSKSNGGISLSNFFKKRALRILPVYIICLVIVFGVIIIMDLSDYQLFLQKQLYFWTFTENLYFAYHGWPKEISILNHFWSLAIEAQFYLVWPFVIMLVPKKWFLTFSFLGITAVLASRFLFDDPHFSYFFTLSRIDTFIFGAVTAFLLREHILLILSSLSSVTVLAVGLFAGTYFMSSGFELGNKVTTSIGFTVLALIFSVLIIWTYSDSRIGKTLNVLLTLKWLKSIGRYSYGIYAYHWILYKAFYNDFLSLIRDLGIPAYNYIAVLIFLIVVYLLSAASYEIYEKRFLNLKRK